MLCDNSVPNEVSDRFTFLLSQQLLFTLKPSHITICEGFSVNKSSHLSITVMNNFGIGVCLSMYLTSTL